MSEETIMDKKLFTNLTLLIVSFLILLLSQNSFACSCMLNTKPHKTQVKEAFDNSVAVFSGEILEITPKGEYEMTVKIKVGKSWKGKLEQEIILTTAKDSAMCGFSFQTGLKYLVYGYGTIESLSTNICSRTTTFSSQNDTRFLDIWAEDKPKALLYDSFNYSNSEDASARIDNWRNGLNNTPQSRGFVIVYGGKSGKRGEVEAHIRGIKQALHLKGIDEKSISISKGGYREKLAVEFWIVSQGAELPKPSPTVNSKQVRLRGVSKKIIPYECCF